MRRADSALENRNYLSIRRILAAMNSTRCLGLIGGLGVGAAVHYYVKLAKAHHAEERTLDMVMVHAEPPRVMEFIKAGNRQGLAKYLVRFILRMSDAGADFAVVPAVTPHYCIHELMAISPLPVLDIFTPLNRAIAARGFKRVASLERVTSSTRTSTAKLRASSSCARERTRLSRFTPSTRSWR